MIAFTRLLAVLVLAVWPLVIGGCASSGEKGHLVIVGGGLSDSNAEVFRAFVDRCADGPIGIVPTASGDGLAAGESNVTRFRQYAGDRPVIVIPLTQFDADKANDASIADLIASCGGLWFTGGDQSRITKVFRPDAAGTTPIYKACLTVLKRGGVIGGTSAGAAIMTDPMITGGRARATRVQLDPENESATPGVRIGVGMGFLDVGTTDQHFLERARMGRLIEALALTNQPFGYGISEDSAMIIDRHTGRFTVAGELGVILIDRTTDGPLRLSAFSTDDRGHVKGAWLSPASGRVGVESGEQHAPVVTLKNVYSRDAIMHLARALGNGVASASVRDGDLLMTLTRDRRTRVYRDTTGTRPPLVVDAILSIQPASGSSP